MSVHLIHKGLGVFTTDENFFRQIQQQVSGLDSALFSVFHQNSLEKAIDFLNYELPDFLIMDLDTPIPEIDRIAELLKKDPWHSSTGIICISSKRLQTDSIRENQRWNLINVIDKEDTKTLQRVLRRVLQDTRTLVDGGYFAQFKSNDQGRIIVTNNIQEAQDTANLISSYLFSNGNIDQSKYYGLSLALSELLINAVEHGNCGISFDDKTHIMDTGQDMFSHVLEIARRPEVKDRIVTIDYDIQEEQSTWIITDMGDGFDVQKYLHMDPLEVLTLSHGRGIFMAKNSGDRLFYNEKGNQVTLICRHEGKGREIPEGFQSLAELNFPADEYVFRQGDQTDGFYYIIEGEFSVQINSKTIYTITANEHYLGRLSFLLKTNRIADIICTKKARLCHITDQCFEEIFSKFPNYGLVLTRLLAQRLSIINDEVSSAPKKAPDLLPTNNDIPDINNLPCGRLVKDNTPFTEFATGEVVNFPQQAVIFHRNEDSSHLYFIIDGKFDVLGAQNKIVGKLEKQDFFVGEMSFLLNNKRTATVTTSTDSMLLKISRKEFIHIVKTRPYYVLLLATLLAHRLMRILL